MKVFIWNDPYNVSYGSSLLFAVAETVEQAREVARTAPAYEYGELGRSTPLAELGEPIRVLNIPCAEWHEWSE